MGWSFGWKTKEKLRAFLTRNEKCENADRVCLCHTLRGNTLWSVWEIREEGKEPRRYIGCDLISKHREHDFGYKDMREIEGPYYYNCPLTYLNMVPVANKEWREKVRTWHEKQKREFKIGEIVTLQNCRIPHLRIETVTPLLGSYEGKVYRVPRKLVA